MIHGVEIQGISFYNVKENKHITTYIQCFQNHNNTTRLSLCSENVFIDITLSQESLQELIDILQLQKVAS